MAVFALTCRDCGAPVEIPGRYGFKLKNTGISTTLCAPLAVKRTSGNPVRKESPRPINSVWRESGGVGSP